MRATFVVLLPELQVIDQKPEFLRDRLPDEVAVAAKLCAGLGDTALDCLIGHRNCIRH
jgi:hypothetical protein